MKYRIKTIQSVSAMRMRNILVTLAVLASFLWAGVAHPSETALPTGNFADMQETQSAQVLEVISPLTLKLASGDIIRLSGITMPGYTAETADSFAVTSLNILRDMYEGQMVRVYQTRQKDWGRTDRMGQKLAHIARQSDGAWAQGTLVGLGLAQVKTEQRTPEMADQLYALEAYARKNGDGIWAEEAKVLSAAEAGEHLNSFQIVEGRVVSAAINKNRIYLNFGQNWRDDFTVSIAPESRKTFTKAGLNPLEWNGKTLRVRGWVEDYNGAYIEIDHPEALEILN
ncbi:MAG: thermonuclease family protein [Magnetococcus sp. WYHC-3]